MQEDPIYSPFIDRKISLKFLKILVLMENYMQEICIRYFTTFGPDGLFYLSSVHCFFLPFVMWKLCSNRMEDCIITEKKK